VRAALLRDLVCRSSCPTCSSVSCWAAPICSACASIAAWSFKNLVAFFGPPGGLFITASCACRSTRSVRFCLQQLGSVDCQLLLLLLLKCSFLLGCRCGFEIAACVPLKLPFQSNRCCCCCGCCGCCWGGEEARRLLVAHTFSSPKIFFYTNPCRIKKIYLSLLSPRRAKTIFIRGTIGYRDQSEV